MNTYQTNIFRLAAPFIFAAALFATGCEQSTDPTPQQESKVLVSSQTIDGLTIDVYADDSLITGYNPMYVKLRRGSTIINNADVSANPMMDMGMMKHSCPVEPFTDTPSSEGYYTGAIIFTMPGSANEWSIDLTVQDPATGSTIKATLPVAIASSENVKVVKIEGQGKTIVTLKPPKWSVGMNTVNFLVYSTTDGFTYTPRTDLTPTVEPTMPSMGHGSPGNVNPTHSNNGLYTGKVNFTMTGDWDIAFGWTENNQPQVVHFPVLVN